MQEQRVVNILLNDVGAASFVRVTNDLLDLLQTSADFDTIASVCILAGFDNPSILRHFGLSLNLLNVRIIRVILFVRLNLRFELLLFVSSNLLLKFASKQIDLLL